MCTSIHFCILRNSMTEVFFFWTHVFFTQSMNFNSFLLNSGFFCLSIISQKPKSICTRRLLENWIFKLCNPSDPSVSVNCVNKKILWIPLACPYQDTVSELLNMEVLTWNTDAEFMDAQFRWALRFPYTMFQYKPD